MKSISLKELSAYLDQYLESGLFQDYCPNGLQVEGKREVRKVGFAVSASLSVIEKAVKEKCDVLVVHHGIFWKGDSFPVTGVKRQKLSLLLENGISLFGYHLPLDAHREVGNNWLAAKELGWEDLEPFGKFNGSYIGVKGRFPKTKIKKFQNDLEKYYDHTATVVEREDKELTTAALISGGAYKEISGAINEGLDAFITGNFDEPAFWDAKEGNIHFLALGHYATERIGVKALKEHLEGKWGIATTFIDVENPF